LLVQYSTNLGGFWRIVALGGIVDSTAGTANPIARLFVRRLVEQEGDPLPTSIKMEPDLAHVDVPLGETLALYTGAILRDNRLVQSMPPDMEVFQISMTFRADTNAINPRRSFRHQNGNPLFHSALAEEHIARIDSLLMLSRDTDDHHFRVIVPCQEIFRFYYLTSSRMGRIIASPDILDPHKSLFDERHSSYSPNTGEARLMVRQGILPSDVPLLARLLANDTYGLQAAKSISHHMMAQRRARETAAIWAKPPFEGAATWKVFGHVIEDVDRRYLVVFRILSCTAPFGFTSLKWRYTNESDSVVRGKSSPKRGNSGLPSRIDAPLWTEFIPLEGGEQPSTRFLTKIVAVDDLEGRFPALNLSMVLHERKPAGQDEAGPGIKAIVVPGDASSSSAQKGSSGGDKGRREINLAIGKPRSRSKTVESDARDNNPRDALKLVLDLCDELERSGCIRVDRVDERDVASGFGRVFNYLPKTVNNKKIRFLYLDAKKTIRRPLYIAEFSREDRYGYLMELVRSAPGEEYCTLLIWEKDNKTLTPADLSDIIDSFAAEKKFSLTRAKREAHHLHTHRLLHIEDTEPYERAASVEKILRLHSASRGSKGAARHTAK